MTRLDVLELAGILAVLGGAVVVGYACWQVAPEVLWLYIGVCLMAAGSAATWLGNGGFR